MIGIYMFFSALLLLSIGYPVAFSFGAISILFGFIASFFEIFPDGGTMIEVSEEFFSMFSMMPFRIYSTMTNTLLMAVPLFIFMGIVLEKSGLAARLLESMGTLFGKIRGGLAISTVLVGSLLAASTGVVGASVVAMGVISLPVMLKYGYNKPLACGTICASGTLGQIIPPSIILIILSDVFGQPAGDMFRAAMLPSAILVGSYILYILFITNLNKDLAPLIEVEDTGHKIKDAILAIIPPLLLVVIVLGSIFAGIATPTESASVGSVGAIILAALYKSLSWKMIEEASLETVKITAMVIAILIGATAFSLVFVYTGADSIVEEFMMSLPGEKWGFLILSMLVIMLLGFFIDFFEISYIVVPILIPIADAIGINPMWFAILIAMNLQTSFLTPPFGFSLFYLKGVAKNIKTTDIYKGVIPFIIIQILVLASIVIFPEFYGF
ncbi:MAG: TRAP transporter large permease subunit [Campylobacterota bacterium]|nr:TRAP transporter large permease subunit [Campylobacterota bacterium]